MAVGTAVERCFNLATYAQQQLSGILCGQRTLYDFVELTSFG